MTRAGSVTSVLIGFAMFVASAAAANKGSFQIQSPTVVGATQLPAGEYSVQWEGVGPDVELKIRDDNRVRVTVSAKVMQLDHPLHENAILIARDSDGSKKLLEIRFSGKKFLLRIEPQSDDVSASNRKGSQ